MMTSFRDQMRAKLAGRCVHFNGSAINKSCAQSIVYEELTDNYQKRLPCFAFVSKTDTRVVAQCDKKQLLTQIEIEKEIDEIEAQDAKTALAHAAAHEHAKQNGLGKGHGGSGVVKCPVCPDGQIKYSIASVNGHMWARCTTEGCARWVE